MYILETLLIIIDLDLDRVVHLIDDEDNQDKTIMRDLKFTKTLGKKYLILLKKIILKM